MTNVVELEEINVCPECSSRSWQVIETRSSDGPFCRCSQCEWEAEHTKTEASEIVDAAAKRITELIAQCNRLSMLNTALLDSAEEVERLLKFAFDDGGLSKEIIMGLCVDPYGVLSDLRNAIAKARTPPVGQSPEGVGG